MIANLKAYFMLAHAKLMNENEKLSQGVNVNLFALFSPQKINIIVCCISDSELNGEK
jgi:hypothetical protein